MCWSQRKTRLMRLISHVSQEFRLSSRRRYKVYVSHNNISINPQEEEIVEALIGSPGGI